MAFFRAGACSNLSWPPTATSATAFLRLPTELSLPDMIATGARYGVGGFLLGELLFADRAGFRHRVSHKAYSFRLWRLAYDGGIERRGLD